MRVRSIVHLDADAFFASVEQAADARLRGKPIAVGGEKRGIIASASYEARKYGIFTPMPTALARRLCPSLTLLAGDFEKYELFSRLMFSYAYDVTPDVEIGSIDEGYFDITGVRQPAMEVAQKIRHAIRQSLRLPVSEGLGTNKLVSQIASKLKKPSAFEFVPAGSEAEFLAPLAARWLPGVGPKTASQLQSAGLASIGQVARTPVHLLNLLVGGLAPQLRLHSQGIDERPVVPVSAPAKSYSEQETFDADTTDEQFLEAILRRMADRLMAKVRADGKSIRTVTVRVRYNDMDEQQASESQMEPTDLEGDIYGMTSTLLRRAWQRRVSLRMVSLKLSNVYEGCFWSGLKLDAASGRHEAEQRLAGVVDELRTRYGRGALLRGHDFVLRETAEAAKPGSVWQTSGKLRADNTATAERAPRKPPAAPRSSPAPDLLFRQDADHVFNRAPAPARQAARGAFIPLNVHSYYSFLDSTLSIGSIIDLARRHSLPAIALTDTNNLHGAVEFSLAAAEAGIKPVIGAEIRLEQSPLRLYVENHQGYRNLCRILSMVATRQAAPGRSSVVPELTREQLATMTEGLLAASPSPALAALFPDRFYLEITNPEALRHKPALPCVASLPVHYEAPGDRLRYDILQSIRTLTLLRQAHPEKKFDGQFHFQTPAEMRSLFGAYPGLLARSYEIAERCTFALAPGKPQFPAYVPPDGSRAADYLRRLVMEGLRQRYPKTHEQHRAQVEEELAIITEVGYEEYFLIMWDILEECRREGIEWITRGSAADSLACYCLGISGVCPLRFDLYFRRFLNRDRMALNKLPDIDVDFPHDRKDDVVDLIFKKFGRANTAVVGGFSTFQARSAFAEVAKVLGASEHQVRRITERFPHYSRAGELAEATAGTVCGDLPLSEEPYATALAMGQFLDGFPRYPKMHPCGVVVSRQRMEEITPCFISGKGYPTAHFDMDSVEAVGLVKMDILAQGGLAVMRDVREMVGPGLRNLEELEPWDDPEVWDMIASGGARAVHHIESPAMISLCKMCNVRDIDTLIAIVSVIRPGAANESKKMEFARRYQGLSPVRYPHPSVAACLRSTYGLVVYEEHILQMCEAFAGLAPGRADILRRALAKEKAEVIAQIEKEFTKCARVLGRTEAEIAEVWGLVTGFRGYAFCKAHSTAYGVEAYQSAWLKRYHPAEFMAAVLTNGKGFYHPLVYILECHRLGIRLLPPTINEPGPAFKVTSGGEIRIPVLNVKGLAEQTAQRILHEREQKPFASLSDFFQRVHPGADEIEALIRIGAFDEFGLTRAAQYWEYRTLAAKFESPRAGEPVQLWLLSPGNLDDLSTVPLTEPTRLSRLRAEEDLLGYTASAHPLELFPNIAWHTYCPINRLKDFIGQTVVTCGLVIEQRIYHQTTGEPMKFMTIADRTGMAETELFARTYRAYGLNTVRYRVLEVTATVEPFENGRGFSLRVHRAGVPRGHDA
jgi:DNA-directed DNA polymerase III PolC